MIRSVIDWFLSWMATQSAQNLLLLANLVAFGFYLRLTRGIKRAANEQTAESRKLAGWQREQWRRDSRGREWKELVGTLTASVLQILTGPPPHAFVPGLRAAEWTDLGAEQFRQAAADRLELSHWLNGALSDAARVIGDRLFITDVLEREHVREEWREIEVISYRLPRYQQTSAAADDAMETDFQQKWVQLRQKLVALAQQDLRIAAPAAGADVGHA